MRTLGTSTLCLALALLLLPAMASGDARTKPIRLVPQDGLDWSASPQPIAVSGEVTIAFEDPKDSEKVTELKESMDEWTAKAFKKLKYTVDDGAPLQYRYTIDYIDWGSKGKQLMIGAGAGRAEGTVVLTTNGEKVGRYRYSAKVRIFGGAGKQIAPPLVLKLHKGERDEELHERRDKAEG